MKKIILLIVALLCQVKVVSQLRPLIIQHQNAEVSKTQVDSTTNKAHAVRTGKTKDENVKNTTAESNRPYVVVNSSSNSYRSASFAGGNEYIEIPHNSAQNLTSTFTIEGWFKVDSFDHPWTAIIAKGENSWRIHREVNSNVIRFDANAGDASSTLLPEMVPNVNVVDGKWHHFAVTSDGTNRYFLLDGVIEVQDAAAQNMKVETNPIMIGENPGARGRYFNGNIDEIRIWNIHRTPEQIKNYMFQAINPQSSGLVGYYTFDGTTVNGAVDETNTQSGTFANGATISTTVHPVGTRITGNVGWRLMSSPVKATIGDVLESIWTQGFTGADTESGSINVYTYTEGGGGTDVSERGFKAVTNAADSVAAGQGLLVYVYEDDDYGTSGVQGGFPKTIQLDKPRNYDNITPQLTVSKSGTEGAFNSTDDGWHLVGNPYAYAIDWDSDSWTRSGLSNTIYVWSDAANSGTGAYLSWNGETGTLGGGELSPFQGFWVKALNGDPISLTFTEALRSGSQVLYKRKEHPLISLKVYNDNMTNQAKIIFMEDAEKELDRWDAYKLNSLNSEWISVATRSSDSQAAMDIQALPNEFDEMRLEIPIQASKGGSFVLDWNFESIPDNWSIQLIDHQNESINDMRALTIYQFEQQAAQQKRSKEPTSSTNPSIRTSQMEGQRFELLISSGSSTSNENLMFSPDDFTLFQNYPNPFNPTTNISYSLPESGWVELSVYDITGRAVASLVNGIQQSGNHMVKLEAAHLPSGLYFYHISWNGQSQVRKMLLLK